MGYEEAELFEKLTRILEDGELRKRWKAAGERIRAENRIARVVDQIVDYVCQTKDAPDYDPTTEAHRKHSQQE